MTEPKNDPRAAEKTPRAEWKKPAIVDLPRLVDLTLQTGEGIPGGGGPGSTIIG